MGETPWVRSLYLYFMCVVSIALLATGAIGAVVGAVHTVAPDLGHRDTLDRVGIGVSNIASNVADLFADSQNKNAEEMCRDATSSDGEFDECVAAQSIGADNMEAIQDGIAEVRSELQSQIRNNSVDRLIRGLLTMLVGLVLLRIHSRRAELFADGLLPKKADTVPAAPAVTIE